MESFLKIPDHKSKPVDSFMDLCFGRGREIQTDAAISPAIYVEWQSRHNSDLLFNPLLKDVPGRDTRRQGARLYCNTRS